MFKSILVPVDGSNFGAAQTAHAIQIAKTYNGKITFLFVVDIKIVEGPLLRDMTFLSEAVTSFEYHDEVKNSLEEKGKAALEKVRAMCAEAGVACEVRIVPGVVANTIAEQGRLADVIVMGKRGENASFGGAFLGNIFETTARISNKPILACDDAARNVGKLLFAYDGSASANKALQMVADIATNAKMEVAVINVYEDETEGRAIIAEAMTYLGDYGLKAVEVLKPGDVVPTIIATAEELGSDMIVMGAYGHSTIHQMLLGSMTTLLIRAAKVPVLLYR